MLKRLFLWIIRCIAMLGLVGGILMIIGGAMGMGATLIPGIVVTVVSLVIGKLALKKSEKAQNKSRQTCKKCKQSLAGAYYCYRSDFKRYKEAGGMYVQVAVNVTCPHCGKVHTFIETVYCHEGESTEAIKRDLDNRLEDYYG